MRPVPAPRRHRRYRRSPAILFYWTDHRLAYFDCASGERRTAPVEVVPLLDQLGDWTTVADLRSRHPELGSRADVEGLLHRLLKLGLVEQATRRSEPWPWTEWMPEAAFFHFGTRDANYPIEFLAHEARLREKAKTIPQPAPTKTLTGPRIALPPADGAGEIGAALRARRTWRNFGATPVSLDAVSSLLGLTWGVHRRGRVEGQGDVVFKTSPSGGSRHPIEAYLIAQQVSGLRPGAYHYDCARHELVHVARPIPRNQLIHLLANQYYFGSCAALFVMTACFRRTMWRYPFRRAYRSVLIEAGHLGQTFCLLATAMGLAPFTTIAFQDSRLETLLRVDDAAESAIYVVGVGSQDADAIDQPGRIPPKEAR